MPEEVVEEVALGVRPRLTLAAGLASVGLVGGLSGLRAGRDFALGPALAAVLRPGSVGEWTTTIGLVVLAVLGGLGDDPVHEAIGLVHGRVDVNCGFDPFS